MAPISTTVLFSTACKSASCWLLLNLWISSMNRMVLIPPEIRRFSASAISRRRSETVPPIADTSTNVERVDSAITCAMEVFPVPAGPKRMTELSVSASIAARSQLSSPTASRCPTTSSSTRGRRRTARGAALSRCSSSISLNRLVVSITLC